MRYATSSAMFTFATAEHVLQSAEYKVQSRSSVMQYREGLTHGRTSEGGGKNWWQETRIPSKNAWIISLSVDKSIFSLWTRI